MSSQTLTMADIVNVKADIVNVKADIETFINTGPLDVVRRWPKNTVVLVGDEVFRNIEHGDHAEKLALKAQNQQRGGNIVMYSNYSPCDDCAEKILKYADENDTKFEIKFAKVYEGKQTKSKAGLRKLTEKGHSLHALNGSDWKHIVQTILKCYGKKKWQSVLGQILQFQRREGWKKSLRFLIKDDIPEGWNDDLRSIFEEFRGTAMEIRLTPLLQNFGFNDLEAAITELLSKEQEEVDGLEWKSFFEDPQNGQDPDPDDVHIGGYRWLVILLSALEIDANREWMNKRIQADKSANEELKRIVSPQDTLDLEGLQISSKPKSGADPGGGPSGSTCPPGQIESKNGRKGKKVKEKKGEGK